MVIPIDKTLELRLFNQDYAAIFFDSIHDKNNLGDTFLETLRNKYTTPDKILYRIHDAIENKFRVDGTPDFFIFYQGQIAGVFEFHPLSNDDLIEIGFWLFPKFRRNKILSRLFPRMIEYAREQFLKKKIVATTAIDNKPAQILLERYGFKKTEEIDEHLSNGKVEKQFVYEMLLHLN